MITVDELARIQSLAEALRQQGMPIEDYLANGCLFAEFELTQEQRAALRAIAGRSTARRSADTSQQSLFAE